jgi:hypothetical protein
MDDASLVEPQLARYVALLREAVVRYEQSGALPALDDAFSVAAAAVAMLRGPRAQQPPEVDEVRWLFAQLPDFEQLVSVAVHQADRSARDAGMRLWQAFGLRSQPPRWSEAERSRATLLVACACAPLAGHGLAWLRARLLRLASERWASLLAGELRSADEDLWRRALGERYASVHQRCAPRTTWRTRGLSTVLQSDPQMLEALRGRLERWLAAGGELERLPNELEAAFVLGRVPGRLA